MMIKNSIHHQITMTTGHFKSHCCYFDRYLPLPFQTYEFFLFKHLIWHFPRQASG